MGKFVVHVTLEDETDVLAEVEVEIPEDRTPIALDFEVFDKEGNLLHTWASGPDDESEVPVDTEVIDGASDGEPQPDGDGEPQPDGDGEPA